MARDVKQSINFYPGVDTEFDRLNDTARFSSTIINMADGSVVTNEGSGTFAELIRPTNGHKSTTDGAASIGDATVTLSTTDDGLVVGDAFDDGAGNLYYISSRSGQVIGLKRPLVADIADATELDEVGNTGLYKVECQIADLGEYMVTIAHPEFGNIALKYVVVENTMDDAVANANSRFDAIDSKLASIGAKARMVAIA